MTDFWSKVEKSDGCWNWKAAITSTGYGNVFQAGKFKKAHRVAYELMVGPIPEGLTLDHLCRNRACVNPDHLEAVTQRENVLRRTRLITACPNGHAYDAANTYLTTAGKRLCKACNRDRMRQRRAAAA